MQIKLDASERQAVLSLLPREANVLTIRAVANCQKTLGFSEEEIAAASLPDGRYQLDKIGEKEFHLSGLIVDIVKEKLRTAANTNRLPISHLSLFDKILPDYKDPDEKKEG